MASFNKFNAFIANLANKVFNLSSDSLKVALTDSAPTSANANLADITEISYTNISSRVITTSSSSQTGGTYKLILNNLVLTASGAVGPFRYVAIYDDTAASKQLIGYYDYGAEVTMASGDTFTLNFDATNGLIQIA